MHHSSPLHRADAESDPIGPAYRVHTRRLVIRCWDPDDAPLLKEAIDSSLDHLRPWMPWAHHEPTELGEKIALLRRFRGMFDLGQDFVYGVFNRDESKVLGGTGLHARLHGDAREIGYWIRQDQTGHGLATELSAALVKVAFEVERVNRVEIHCDPENITSAAIPKKLGFNLEATLRQRLPAVDETLRDVMIWTLFVDEFPQSPAAKVEIEAFNAARQRLL